MGRLLSVALLAFGVAIPAHSEEVCSFHRSFDAHGIRALVVDIPRDEGSGSSRLRLETGIGEIDVRLK